MFSDGSGIQVFWNRMKAYLSGVSTPAILPIPVVSIASEEPGSTHLILSSDYAGLDAEVRYKKGSEPADTDTLFPSDGLDITEDGTYYFRAFSTDSAHIDSPSLMMDRSIMELPQLDAPQITQSVMDEGTLMTISNWYDYPSGAFVYTTAGNMLNSNNYIIFDDDFTADTMEVTITVNCEGYLSASTTVTVNKPVRQLPTPILSTQESGGNIYAVLSNVDNYPDDALVYYSHTLSNPLEGNEYMTISSLKNASVKGAIVMLTISLATLFVAVSCDGYQDSDVGNIDYEFPTLQTPTLSLHRSSSQRQVVGNIGNMISGAIYRYKVGSAPASITDGSGVDLNGQFYFDNINSVTVYVVGFKEGYRNSNYAYATISAATYPEAGNSLPLPIVVIHSVEQVSSRYKVSFRLTNLSAYELYMLNPNADIKILSDTGEGYNERDMEEVFDYVTSRKGNFVDCRFQASDLNNIYTSNLVMAISAEDIEEKVEEEFPS